MSKAATVVVADDSRRHRRLRIIFLFFSCLIWIIPRTQGPVVHHHIPLRFLRLLLLLLLLLACREATYYTIHELLTWAKMASSTKGTALPYDASRYVSSLYFSICSGCCCCCCCLSLLNSSFLLGLQLIVLRIINYNEKRREEFDVVLPQSSSLIGRL